MTVGKRDILIRANESDNLMFFILITVKVLYLIFRPKFINELTNYKHVEHQLPPR